MKQKEGIHGDVHVRKQGETNKQELDIKSGMFVVCAKNLPLKMLGLYLYTFLIGQLSCNMLSILNKSTI